MSGKKPKRGLGRGLSALFPEYSGEAEESISRISVQDIRPNPLQPRRGFDEEAIQELAQSIATHGVLQPLVLRRGEEGYELVAGERRWRAAKEAGLEVVPALVKEIAEAELMEIALVENLQREDLNSLEEAEAYRSLLDEYGLTQEELSVRVGKSRSHIANTLRLLHLEPEVREYVSRGTLSMGHARALLGAGGEKEQVQAAKKVVEEGLSVRETEELVRAQSEGAEESANAPAPAPSGGAQDPNLRSLEDRLQENLGFKVRIKAGKKKGRLEIEYYSVHDLEQICTLLGVNPES